MVENINRDIKNSPIFIIGNPRSGTTLLQLMLTSHPNLSIPTECGFLIHLYDKYKNFEGEEFEIVEFVNAVFDSRKFELWKLDFENTLSYVVNKKPRNYAELVASIYEFYAECYHPDAKRWGDKNNYFLNHILEIDKIFPNAQYIHIIRDGRDVACSYKDMEHLKGLKYAPNLPHGISEIANQWKMNISKIRESFDVLGWEKVIEIRYEDLTLNPQDILNKICDFLNITYSDEMLRFNENNKENELVPKEFDAWKSMNKEKLSSSRIQRWKDELTKEEILIFELKTTHILSKYNYI